MRKNNFRIIALTIAVSICFFSLGACQKQLPHIHVYETSIVEPACSEQGYTLYVCSCGDWKKEDFKPELGHELRHYKGKPATCESIGYHDYECCIRNGCEYSTYTEIKPLGHSASVWVEIVAPTCSAEGVESAKCERCGMENAKRAIPKLPHKESGWIVDKQATSTQEGYRHTECLDCKTIIKTESIPQLNENLITYRINIRDYDGVNYIPSGWRRVGIYDTQWKMVGEDWEYGDNAPQGKPNGGFVDFKLPLGTYYVKILKIMDGYAIKDYYTISSDMGKYPYLDENDYPTITIVCDRSLRKGPAPSGTIYDAYSTLYDFSEKAYTYKNGQVLSTSFTLSELLKTKQVVLLNFFYNSCYYCREELPYFKSFYEKYKEQVAIIMIDDTSYGGSAYDFCERYSLPFYLLDDNGYVEMYRDNFITGFPTTLIIDRRGMIRERLSSIKSEEILENAVIRYFNKTSKDYSILNSYVCAQNQLLILNKERFL